MTAVSDETGGDWLPLKYEDGPDFCTVTLATGAAFALTVHPERMKLMEAALSASPVAQEPVAYLRDVGQTASDGEYDECLVPASKGDPGAFAVYRDPPATPAGLGADEIAQIIATKCFDPRVIDSSGKPFWKKSQWREAQQAANAILALLSRAGDQGNSTQKDGSR